MHSFSLLCTDGKAKLLQASENLSALNCMPASETALRVQSSANKKSLMVPVKTLVFAGSLLRLKTEPSVRYLMPMPPSTSPKASVSIAENMRLNSVGARTQPCFTLFEIEKGSEVFPLS